MGKMKERLAANELVLCMSIGQARTVDIAMMVEASGFDAIYVDMEHTATSLETASMLCAASLGIGLTPMVRVPSHHPHDISRALDTGAVGVVVPHVRTKAQAEQIVRACRFPPLGDRSIIGPNPVSGYRPMRADAMVDYLNRETIVVAMLESPEAIEQAEAIASVPGLDMLLIGSYDLSAEMGILGKFQDQRFRAAVAKASEAARRHGKVMGIAGLKSELELLAEFVAAGVRFISAGTDAGYFVEAARASADKLRTITTNTIAPNKEVL